MTQITPASARLVVPCEDWVAAYVAAQQPSDGSKPLPREIVETLAQSVIRIVQKAPEPASGKPKILYQQFWMVADSSVIGHVVLRPHIDPTPAATADHIGYHVFPAFRGQGFGHRAVALGIEELRRQGIEDLLLICEDDNKAAIRIIETAGGILEAIMPHPDFPERPIRRYWIRKQRKGSL